MLEELLENDGVTGPEPPSDSDCDDVHQPAPSSSSDLPPPSAIRDCLLFWREAYNANHAVLSERFEAIDNFRPEVRRDNVSLVTTQCAGGVLRCDYVHWIRDAAKRGWALRVHPDRQQRIKYAVGGLLGEPAFDLEHMIINGSATFVHPDIGVPMCKQIRLDIPTGIQRLKKIWTIALDGSVNTTCGICSRDCDLPACPLCEFSVHPSCVQHVIDQHLGVLWELGCPPETCGRCLPRWWDGKLCTLCLRFQQTFA